VTAQQNKSAYVSSGNPLCDRLRWEFRGRGAAMASVRSLSTAAMMDRVQRGLDPYENAPDPTKEARREAPEPPRVARAGRPAPAQTRTRQRPAARNASGERTSAARPAAQAATRPASAHPVPAQARTRQNPPARNASEGRTSAARTAARPADGARRRSARLAAVLPSPVTEVKTDVEEIRLEKKPFPLAAISLLVVFTMMFLVVVFSFAQNYVLTSEIAALEARAEALAQQEKDLSLKLEERDDIRVIEDIAVNQIGMVKGNMVESRFVSVSGGERVELLSESGGENAEEESYGFFSTMLSAISDNLERLREYVD